MSRIPDPTHTGRNERGRRVVLCQDPHDGRFLNRNEIKARYAGATREWGTYTEIRPLTNDEARDLLDEKLLRTLRRLRALGDDGVSHDDLDLPIEQLRVKFRWVLERFAADPDWLDNAMRRMSEPGWAAEAAKNAVVTVLEPPLDRWVDATGKPVGGMYGDGLGATTPPAAPVAERGSEDSRLVAAHREIERQRAGWMNVTRDRDVIRAQRNRAEDQLTSALRTLRSVLNEAGGIDGRLKDDPVSVRVRAEIEDILSLLSGGVKDAPAGEPS
jgi:hypothetical protein